MALKLSDIGRKKFSGEAFDPKTIEATIERFFTEYVEKTKGNLQASDAVASHKLSQSIRFTVKFFGFEHEYQLIMEDYYKYVDQGVKGSESSAKAPQSPFSYKDKAPPVDDIMKWMAQRSIRVELVEPKKEVLKRLKRRTLKRKLSKSFGLEARRAAAFGIANKIKTHGVEGNKFFSSVINEQSIKLLKQEISKAFKRDVEISITEIKKDLRLN